jgi:hypothetical protein
MADILNPRDLANSILATVEIHPMLRRRIGEMPLSELVERNLLTSQQSEELRNNFTAFSQFRQTLRSYKVAN